ncbi:MAG TPA: hypothetical protein VES64_05120 [Allosphingosinicella sp.]|nr:hypothetical protein [Allosphingosinicella sp.]
MTISRAVLAATLIAGGTLEAATAAAQSPLESLRRQQQGQRGQREQSEEGEQVQRQEARIPNLSREESRAILPLLEAVRAANWTAANAGLPAAQAGARSPGARYLVGQLMLEIGRGTQSQQIQSQAVDAMIASGGAPADVLPNLVAAQAGFALQGNNVATAEAPLTRLLELDPNNVDRIRQLALVKVHLNKRPEALVLFRRALQLSEAGGQRAPEDLHRAALAAAYEGRMLQPSLELSRAMVRAYPSAENWRSALAIYSELGGLEAGVKLDLRRLMRAAGALAGERDYYEYAESVNRAGLPAEAKAVLDEALGRNVFTTGLGAARALLALATRRVPEDRAALPGLKTRALAGSSGLDARTAGDVYYGYGQYAEAAGLYRAALQKGGDDANLINTRLGAALAQAGQRAEAEAALRAVTGARAELAQFWLLWLSTRS